MQALLQRIQTANSFASITIGCALFGALTTVDAATAAGPTMQVVQGRLLVQPRAGLSEQEFDKILKPHGARRLLHIKPINVYVIELPARSDEVAIGNALLRLPVIKFVEAERAMEPTQTPNDRSSRNAWHLPKINANTAWEAAPGDGVTIAILDSGVDSTHPDLAQHVLAGWNFFDNNANTVDVFGHGTKTAGAAAATAVSMVD